MIPIQEQKKLIELFRSDLCKFAKMFFPDLMEYETAAFQEELYWLLQNKDRLAAAAPRGFTKSTLGDVIYPCWAALLMVRKDICLISASETLAVEFLRKVRLQLTTNRMIMDLFGDVQSDKWTENHIVLKNGVNIRAKGAGGQIRGFRPDCIILDDIETDESVESEEQRKKLKEWLLKACLNTLLPGGQLILLGTLIHPLSVLSDFVDVPRQGWERRKYKAYVDGIEAAGHELWPVARPHEWLQKRKSEIGSWAFAAEFMNDPRLDDNVPIKESYLRYWEELPKQYSSVITVDPAYSEDEKADFKVAALIGCDQHMNRFLIDYIRTHEASGTFIDAVLNMWLRNRGTCIGLGCPNSGTEKEFYRSLLNRANERKLYPPLVELKNTFVNNDTGVSTRNKKRRIIAALQPLFEQGKYYIHANQIEARDELLDIGSSRWDDIVDAMTYAESIVQPYFGQTKDAADAESFQPSEVSGDYGYGGSADPMAIGMGESYA